MKKLLILIIALLVCGTAHAKWDESRYVHGNVAFENGEIIDNSVDDTVEIRGDSADVLRFRIESGEGKRAYLDLCADNGDDTADCWSHYVGTNDNFVITNASAGLAFSIEDETLASTFYGAVKLGGEAVTTSAADPGVGVASTGTGITVVTTDDTGDSPDAVTLAIGLAGQIKVIALGVDGEAAGLSVTADYLGATTAALMEDAGDFIVLMSDGTEWWVLVNNGATLS